MVGNLVTSVIAGVVVFVTLTALGIPFPLLWALWVALVDFLPMVGGALAAIPTVLFALGHSLTAGIVTAAVFIAYQQVENHMLNPVVMSRTVKVNPLSWCRSWSGRRSAAGSAPCPAASWRHCFPFLPSARCR
jgi:predicted PurR-regulated permease PerM